MSEAAGIEFENCRGIVNVKAHDISYVRRSKD